MRLNACLRNLTNLQYLYFCLKSCGFASSNRPKRELLAKCDLSKAGLGLDPSVGVVLSHGFASDGLIGRISQWRMARHFQGIKA